MAKESMINTKIEYRKQTHKAMVSECYERMAGHTDEILAEKMNDYFRKNRTMPGEKEVKDIVKAQYEAMQYHKEQMLIIPWQWNQHVPDKYQTDRDDLAHRMSEIAVKDIVLSGNSRPHPVAKIIQPLPFDTFLMARRPEAIEKDAWIHEFTCDVSGKGKNQTYKFTDGKRGGKTVYTGFIPSGFAVNHPNMNGMDGVITTADYSMGRYGNPNILFSIDLMQEPCLYAQEKERKPAELEWDDDFTEAVQRLSNDNDGPSL